MVLKLEFNATNRNAINETLCMQNTQKLRRKEINETNVEQRTNLIIALPVPLPLLTK
jgi:hypothetical protein